MKLFIPLLVAALLGSAVRAEGPDASVAPKKEVHVVAALREFYLAGVALDGIDGTSEHFDVLTFRVKTPDALREQSFAIWVRIPLVVETDESAKERGSYWSKRVGRVIRVSLDERVFSEPNSFPCAFTCARESLKFEEKPNQSLEPTSVLGTSAAEQPLVPSTLVAHL